MAPPHTPFKQSSSSSSISPFPLPFTQFSSQTNMFHPTKETSESFLTFPNHFDDRNSANYCDWNTSVDDESGISSPPLWKTSPQHEKNVNYRCLSPSSRTQAIARGQKELMEMVSRMPESCYELSLKDLVERQPVVVVETEQECFGEGRVSSSADEGKCKKEKQKKSQKQQIKRSGSVDNGGFLLKMVFPVSLGSKKKKKTKKKNNKDCNTSNNTSKVSPKPSVTDHVSGDGSTKTVDKDWWKKRSGSSESDGTGSTINSGSTKSSRSSSSGSYRSISSTSRRHGRRNSCLAFILCRKNKAAPR